MPAPALALYRAPVIALAQPAAGGSIPQDKPVVVFRFAQGEASDAIDARSLVVTVDNVDVSLAFQIAGGDAWGSLARHLDSAHGDLLSVGPHEVTARICSERGACGSVSAVVIAASVQRTGEGSTPATNSRRGKLLDMLVKATRKLLLP